jgi:hypothetical protein
MPHCRLRLRHRREVQCMEHVLMGNRVGAAGGGGEM